MSTSGEVAMSCVSHFLLRVRAFYVCWVISFALLSSVVLFFPHFLLIKPLSLWFIHGSFVDWFLSSLPLFVWGSIISFYVVFTKNIDAPKIENNVSLELYESLYSGIFEEIMFRWFFFFSWIIILTVMNFLLFGFVEWIFSHVFLPVANFLTIGFLKAYLFHSCGWGIGTAVLLANGIFASGHKYLGSGACVNSWFGGMYLFWIMFTYGLPVAILVHFLYNMVVFRTLYYGDSFMNKK